MKFFNNQDWTWGLALIVSGFFFSLFVRKYGVKKFREELVERKSIIKVGKYFDFTLKYIIPLEFVVIIGWWFFKSTEWEKWYNPFGEYSILSVIIQWSVFGLSFFILNKKIAGIYKDE